MSSSKTGLFFGSFNPIHCGHLMIASYMVEYAGLDQVWFVVSPHNPLKDKATLLPDHHRLAMVNLAIADDPRFRSSAIEFKLPQPSYTIDTLAYITEKYPAREFILIAGSDNLPTFHKWKNYGELLKQYKIYLYPRPGTAPSRFDDHPSITRIDAPLITVSSSFIRQGIKEGKDLRHFVPEKVWNYLSEMHFYR
jgi:nicotinate-nucleotide adenylyltransferase